MIDQNFRIRSRLQRCRRKRKIKPVELAPSENTMNRLTPFAPFKRRHDLIELARLQGTLAFKQKHYRLNTEKTGKQNPGIPGRIIDADVRQLLAQPALQGTQRFRRAQRPLSPRRANWSA